MPSCSCNKIGYGEKSTAASHAKKFKGRGGKGKMRQYKCDEGVWHNTSGKQAVNSRRMYDFVVGSVWMNHQGVSFEVVKEPETKKCMQFFNEFSRIK